MYADSTAWYGACHTHGHLSGFVAAVCTAWEGSTSTSASSHPRPWRIIPQMTYPPPPSCESNAPVNRRCRFRQNLGFRFWFGVALTKGG